MKLKQIDLKRYRNISDICLSPCDQINIICGDNAQGKTNILESIWLFTGNPSFKTTKNYELIQQNEKQAELSICFEDTKREQKAQIKISNQKKLWLNQVPLKKSSDLSGHFYCVIFSPLDADLIKGSPKARRHFIDLALSQLTPQYIQYLTIYEKLLLQRNALLKELYHHPHLKNTLDIWDLQLSKTGTIISIYRKDYIYQLEKIVKKIYNGISSGEEQIQIQYLSSAFEEINTISSYEDKHIQYYFDKLQSCLEQDIKCGFTSVGIHRDELDIHINQMSAKTFGSQGQQRSCILALKLGEAALLKQTTKEDPIILLDDVMSELDNKRQNYILNHVKGQQVFITCCDKSTLQQLRQGKIFEIRQGRIVNVTDLNI